MTSCWRTDVWCNLGDLNLRQIQGQNDSASHETNYLTTGASHLALQRHSTTLCLTSSRDQDSRVDCRQTLGVSRWTEWMVHGNFNERGWTPNWGSPVIIILIKGWYKRHEAFSCSDVETEDTKRGLHSDLMDTKETRSQSKVDIGNLSSFGYFKSKLRRRVTQKRREAEELRITSHFSTHFAN